MTKIKSEILNRSRIESGTWFRMTTTTTTKSPQTPLFLRGDEKIKARKEWIPDTSIRE
jgi:hypothetical protein